MINLHRALNNDRLLRALTGLNRKAFDEYQMTMRMTARSLIAPV